MHALALARDLRLEGEERAQRPCGWHTVPRRVHRPVMGDNSLGAGVSVQASSSGPLTQREAAPKVQQFYFDSSYRKINRSLSVVGNYRRV